MRSDNPEINFVSLCTKDGFSVKAYSKNDLNIEADKISAISSTICALSGSAAKQLAAEKFSITIIETRTDNILFVSTQYLSSECVLTLAAKPKMSLANARFCTIRLAEAISKIT